MPPEAASTTASNLAEKIDEEIEAAANEDAEGAEGGEEKGDSEEAVRVASLMGWKPKNEWKGDTANWRSAEDFLADVPDVMRNTRKTNQRLQGQVDRIVGQLAKLDKQVMSTADADVRAQARELMEAGKFDEAEKLLTEGRPTGSAAPDKPDALRDFEERNAEWYGVDDDATAYVEMLDRRYAQQSGGVKDPDAHMRKVEAGVKKAFPHLFGKDKDGEGDEDKDKGERRRAPLVARGTRADRSRGSGAMTVADMSPAQRRAAASMQVSDADWVKAYNASNKDA